MIKQENAKRLSSFQTILGLITDHLLGKTEDLDKQMRHCDFYKKFVESQTDIQNAPQSNHGRGPLADYLIVKRAGELQQNS